MQNHPPPPRSGHHRAYDGEFMDPTFASHSPPLRQHEALNESVVIYLGADGVEYISTVTDLPAAAEVHDGGGARSTPAQDSDEYIYLDELLLGNWLQYPIARDNNASVYSEGGLLKPEIDRYLTRISCEQAAADGGDGEVCVVCQDGLCQGDRTVGILDCAHRFHADCVADWLLLRNVCPLCRRCGLGCSV